MYLASLSSTFFITELMMKETLTKNVLLEELPLCEGHLTIRPWSRQDLEVLAAWPDYPFPHKGFKFIFSSMNSSAKEKLFQARQGNPDGFVLAVDHKDESAVGYVALNQIDWLEHSIGNFGLRIHPNWCDKGMGTSVLRTLCFWLFNHDIESVQVDVAASNTRAYRCYEKVGFCSVGEIWREAPDLKGVDTSLSRYDFLRSHLRQDTEIPKLRFLLMELRRNN